MQNKIDSSYAYIENPIEDAFQREAYFKLARKVFGLDFSVLYTSGYWGDRFIPHTLFDKDKAVASVGVVIHDMKWQGRIKRCLQLSTVMTDPDYQGHGLNRYLMEKVLAKWRDNCDLIYLYANASVADYYPKFGFEKATEYLYSQPIAPKEGTLRKLDLTVPADMEFLAEKYAQSNPFSALTMENNVYLLMFHCLMFLRDNLYYSEKYDAVVIAEVNGDNLFCYDIYTQAGCQRSDILGAFAADGIKTVTFGFTPRSAENSSIRPSQEEDTTLFVLKGKENLFIDNKITFPHLSRA